MNIISSNKLYDPLLDLNKVAGGTLSKNDDAMTWIENYSMVQARDKRKKRGSIVSGTKINSKMFRTSPQLASKDSMTIPADV